MKICNINNLRQSCPQLRAKTTPAQTGITNVFNSGFACGDVVSFSAKKYDSDSITNPTYHCAYCGCKVYTEQQIDAIAKEMLGSKADRLEGKIKSVIEKLEGAKHSQEIELAKRLENKEQIDFFNHLLETSAKKSFLKGEVIFEDVYGLSRDEALELLKKNMHPLLRTIDHVSPQNEEKENHHSDVNLVEACYCCNHNLKKGVSFSEFYTMFPSIKNNMPKDKFEYAVSNLLETSKSGVIQRISASNMLKTIERLFMQRTETANYLASIDYRIQGAKTDAENSIMDYEAQITEKEAEISALEAKFSDLMQEDEYSAMIKREALLSKLEDVKSVLETLQDRRQRTSDFINELRNPSKSSKKQKSNELSEEEKAQKEENLKAVIVSLDSQISAQEEMKTAVELEIEELDLEFPTVEILQSEKSRTENIASAHVELSRERKVLEEYMIKKETLVSQAEELKSQLDAAAVVPSDFRIEKYPPEEQELFTRYQSLVEALKYVSGHQNGNSLRTIINQSAKIQIETELTSLEKCSIVQDYKNSMHKKELELQLEYINKNIAETKNAIIKLQQQCNLYERAAEPMSYQDAQKKINELSESIKRIASGENDIKIPQKIAALKAEITLLNQTIADLQVQVQKIESLYDRAEQ